MTSYPLTNEVPFKVWVQIHLTFSFAPKVTLNTCPEGEGGWGNFFFWGHGRNLGRTSFQGMPASEAV